MTFCEPPDGTVPFIGSTVSHSTPLKPALQISGSAPLLEIVSVRVFCHCCGTFRLKDGGEAARRGPVVTVKAFPRPDAVGDAAVRRTFVSAFITRTCPVHTPFTNPVSTPGCTTFAPAFPEAESVTGPPTGTVMSWLATSRAVMVSDVAAPSRTEEGIVPTTRLAASLSRTCRLSVTAGLPNATALMVTSCAPSSKTSSTATMGTAVLFWPAGMITLAGTVSSETSLLLKVTVTSATAMPPSVSTPPPFVCPAPSCVCAIMSSVTAATSSSVMVIVFVPLVQLATLAVKTTFCGPSSNASCNTVIGKVTLVWPAGTFTVAGTEISLVSLLLRLTAMLAPAGVETFKVPVSVPAASEAELTALRLKTAVSSSVTLMVTSVAV